jgi:hypothetical protein
VTTQHQLLAHVLCHPAPTTAYGWVFMCQNQDSHR